MTDADKLTNVADAILYAEKLLGQPVTLRGLELVCMDEDADGSVEWDITISVRTPFIRHLAELH